MRCNVYKNHASKQSEKILDRQPRLFENARECSFFERFAMIRHRNRRKVFVFVEDMVASSNVSDGKADFLQGANNLFRFYLRKPRHKFFAEEKRVGCAY